MPTESWREALNRHKDDEFAHGPMMATFETGELAPSRLAQLEWQADVGKRLTALERVQWMVAGGLAVISLAAGVGVIAPLGHRLGLW